MASRSKGRGRGSAALVGFVLLIAGALGAGALLLVARQRPTDAVTGFARAPVGCTTTLDFTETGTFYVYREQSTPIGPLEGDCTPAADPSRSFGFELTGPAGPVPGRSDTSIAYDVDGVAGRAVARIEIESTGEHEIVVVGDDPEIVVAVGRDPDHGVDDLRRAAIVVGTVGGVLGLALLVLTGARSRRAAAPTAPQGPGWAARPPDVSPTSMPAWPPSPPTLQVPDIEAEPAGEWVSPWAAPAPGEQPVSTSPPARHE